MEKFERNYNNGQNYQQRSRSSLIIGLVISCILFVVIALIGDWRVGLLVGVFGLAVNILASSQRNRFYILSIVIESGETEISYTDADKEKCIKDRTEFFEFKKKRDQFSKGRSFYMKVYYRNKLIIKQREIGGWNERRFDEAKDAFSERK